MTENARLPSDALAVTKSDTAVINAIGLYVGGAGDVAVVTADEWERSVVNGEAPTAVTFTAPAGATIPVKVAKVMSTGTTATAILAYK